MITAGFELADHLITQLLQSASLLTPGGLPDPELAWDELRNEQLYGHLQTFCMRALLPEQNGICARKRRLMHGGQCFAPSATRQAMLIVLLDNGVAKKGTELLVLHCSCFLISSHGQAIL